jgi:RNA polymerase primary sigma factor
MDNDSKVPYGRLVSVVFGISLEAREISEVVDLSEEMVEMVDAILNTLSEREEVVIRLRFGIDGYVGGSLLSEIGEVLGISSERVRQIESKTISKLRHPERAKYLRKFIRNFG